MEIVATIAAAVKGFVEMLNLFKEIFGLIRQAQKEGWIEEGRSLTEKIKHATTDDERRKLVRDLVGHDGGMP